MSISFNLSKLITERKSKKKDLYVYLGISKQTLEDYLNEKTSMTVATLEKTAKFFNVPVGYFFDEESLPRSSISANNHSVAVGNNSVAGNISLSDYQKENEHLRALLEEKERLIQVLMKK